MIISCSESDVSTTELAPTSTPIPVSTPLPDIKQVPTVEPIVEVKEEPIVEVKEEPIVEVKEEPKDDDFQEGITFDRDTPKTYEEIMMANEELEKKFAEGEHLNAISRGMSIANCSILSPYFICKSERAESTGPESTDTPIMTYEELQKKWSEEREEELRRAKEQEETERLKAEEELRRAKEQEETERLKAEEELRRAKEQAELANQSELLVKETFDSLDNPRRTSQYLGWGKYYDVESLRLFATERITDEFMLRVAATYTLIFSKNDLIDDDLQNTFFKTIRDERVFQRILYRSKEGFSDAIRALTSRYPGGGYQHNSAGYLIYHEDQDEDGREIRRDIFNKILRTTIMTLRLNSDDFDHNNPNSALRKAYQEAVDKNLFTCSGIPTCPDRLYDYDELYLSEFLSNVIAIEWTNLHTYESSGKLYINYKDELYPITNINGERILKFHINYKDELINKLPLSHKLYEEFVEKILNPLDPELFEDILEYNFEPKVY